MRGPGPAAVRKRAARARDKLLYRMPLSVVEHPFEMLIAGLCVVTGPSLLLRGPTATPDTLDDTLPRWLVSGWALAIIMAGTLIILGKLYSLFLERSGMAFFAAGALVYGMTILTQLSPSGVFAGVTYLFFAVAAAIRYAVLGHTIDRIRETNR